MTFLIGPDLVMARSDGFSGLSEFLAVAKHASFRAAAAELGVTPAAVSQAIRTLETKTGLVLFQRTTRRVGLTEAGEKLLGRVRPAAAARSKLSLICASGPRDCCAYRCPASPSLS